MFSGLVADGHSVVMAMPVMVRIPEPAPFCSGKGAGNLLRGQE